MKAHSEQKFLSRTQRVGVLLVIRNKGSGVCKEIFHLQLFLGFVLILFLAGLAWPAQGQVVFVNGTARAESKQNVSAEMAVGAVQQALADLQKKLAGQKPKCFLVTDNLGAAETVSRELDKAFQGSPWSGLANNWGDYLPIDRDTLSQSVAKERGLVITAVCGEVDAELQMVEGLTKKDVPYDLPKEQWRQRWDEQGPAHAAKGEELVKKFRFRPEAGETTVLMVSGTMHTPRQEYVFKGIQRVLPQKVKLIGGSGADFSTVYFNGKRSNNALFGLRLSGRFQAVATGSKGGDDKVKTALPEHLERLTRELHGARPTALIYFGCAGWRTALETQQRVLQQYLPEGLGIYGQFCGGEMGLLQSQTNLVADTDLGVFVMMAPVDLPR